MAAKVSTLALPSTTTAASEWLMPSPITYYTLTQSHSLMTNLPIPLCPHPIALYMLSTFSLAPSQTHMKPSTMSRTPPYLSSKIITSLSPSTMALFFTKMVAHSNSVLKAASVVCRTEVIFISQSENLTQWFGCTLTVLNDTIQSMGFPFLNAWKQMTIICN